MFKRLNGTYGLKKMDGLKDDELINENGLTNQGTAR